MPLLALRRRDGVLLTSHKSVNGPNGVRAREELPGHSHAR